MLFASPTERIEGVDTFMIDVTSQCDINADRQVSGADFTIWADPFGQSAAVDAVTVPETTGCYVLLPLDVAEPTLLCCGARVTLRDSCQWLSWGTRIRT